MNMNVTLKCIVAVLLLAATISRAEAPKPVDLFNGKDLSGWKHAGLGAFEVKDGELHTQGGMGLLWNEREFGDFVLTLEFKTSRPQDNSGIFVRFGNPGDDPRVAIDQGHEIQVCDTDDGNRTGAIYNAKNSTELATRPVGEWNKYEITVIGPKYTVKLNDKVVNEFVATKPLMKGHIGLQNHDPKSLVSYRNVQVTPILPPPLVIAPQAVDTNRAAGLVGEYFKDINGLDDIAKAKTPFLVRMDDRIGFDLARGQFHRTKLSANFGARWNGFIRIEKAGDYTFVLRSDDRSRLYLGDKLVIDDIKMESMRGKNGAVTLSPGDYPIRLEYMNSSGPSGCVLAWRNEEGKSSTIPASTFFHDKAQEKIDWDQAAWTKTRWSYRDWALKNGGAWDKMDYGPFLSHTIELDEKNVALKGIAIKLGKNQEASILFDTELLRFACGWTGGFLELRGVAFDGSHGGNPAPDGERIFTAAQLPGAAAGDSPAKLSADPRPRPFGPLARDWAKYKGFYLHDNHVVLHYTVGDVDVLDMPWAETVGDQTVLTRTIQLGASDQPLIMLADTPSVDQACVIVTPDDVKIESAGTNRYLVFPPRKESTTYKISYSRTGAVPPDALKQIIAAKDDLNEFIKPGAARWTQPIVTQGEMSTSTTQPYVLDTITVPEENPYHAWMRFGGLDFFSDGRAALCTWSGDVWVVSGIDGKLDNITWKRFATGLFQPLGLKIVDDQIYVLGRDQITRFKDTNNDGEADVYENFNNDCEVSTSFHEFSFDLQTDPQGNFYFAKAGPVRPGGRGWETITAHNGCVLKVSKDGQKFEIFATGVRAPNGISVGPNGEVTIGDNEGTWMPACRLSMVHQGDFLGVVDLARRDPAPTTYDKPICWFPHSVDNSSGGQEWVTSDKWGPFPGRLLHTSYGTCSLFLVMTELVDGQIQGGAVKFPQLNFNTGICRPKFRPVDGQLFVAGLRGWQTTGVKEAGFQRIRYTGAPVKMPTEMHVNDQGVAITFTTALDPSAADATNWSVEQWNYLWSSEYGSPEFSVADPKEKAHDPVEVEKVTLSPDGKTAFLKLEAVVPVMQMKIQMKIKSADGSPMDYLIYNTINKVAKSKPAPATAASAAK